jgi:hypothetical protein
MKYEGRHRQASQVIRCSRCGKRYRGRGEWNCETKSGRIVAHLCPGCQTPEENAEAELNLATQVYTGFDADGRVTGHPKTLDD